MHDIIVINTDLIIETINDIKKIWPPKIMNLRNLRMLYTNLISASKLKLLLIFLSNNRKLHEKIQFIKKSSSWSLNDI